MNAAPAFAHDKPVPAQIGKHHERDLKKIGSLVLEALLNDDVGRVFTKRGVGAALAPGHRCDSSHL